MSLVCGVVAQSKLLGLGADWRIPLPADRQVLGQPAPAEAIAVLKLDEQQTKAGAVWPWHPPESGFLVVAQPHSSWADIKQYFRSLGKTNHQGKTMLWPWYSPVYLRHALLHAQPGDLAGWFGPLSAFLFLHEQQAIWVKHHGQGIVVREEPWL